MICSVLQDALNEDTLIGSSTEDYSRRRSSSSCAVHSKSFPTRQADKYNNYSNKLFSTRNGRYIASQNRKDDTVGHISGWDDDTLVLVLVAKISIQVHGVQPILDLGHSYRKGMVCHSPLQPHI